MKWTFVRYENGMSHMVSEALIDAVKLDMARSDPPGVLDAAYPESLESSVHLEEGGMCMVTRPIEEFSIFGLTISIPSEHLDGLVAKWRRAPVVTSQGLEFYRLTSWPWKCLVVDPRQRVELLTLLDARLEVAERRAAAFYADARSPQEVLREINEARGASIPYGPDPLARLRGRPDLD